MVDQDLVGSTFGQFQIVGLIGRGGMSTVYKAYQPSLDRHVAIKILPPYFAHDPEFVERFYREARAVARLEHPNILPVYDCGQQGGVPYIVMALTTGGTIQDRIGPPLPVAWALRVCCQVAGALDHAHGHDIVHRDVKPTNLLLHKQDWVLLADFGIAKMLHGDTRLTKAGMGVGTVGYMSPEQAQGFEVDGRSDLYSLAIVLVEMLTGMNPFAAETPLAMVLKQINGPSPSVRGANPEVPRAVEEVIQQALNVSPGERFQSAAAFAEALEAAAEGGEEDRARRLDELRERLGQTVGEQKWDEAIQLGTQILALEPGDDATAELLPRVVQHERMSRERQAAITELLGKARGAADQHRFEEALAAIDLLLNIDRDNAEARSLRTTIARTARLSEQLEEAERLLEAGQLLAARECVQAVLSEDPFNRRALGLLGLTERPAAGLPNPDRLGQADRSGEWPRRS